MGSHTTTLCCFGHMCLLREGSFLLSSRRQTRFHPPPRGPSTISPACNSAAPSAPPTMRYVVLLAALVALLATGELPLMIMAVPTAPAADGRPCTSLAAFCLTEEAARTSARLSCTDVDWLWLFPHGLETSETSRAALQLPACIAAGLADAACKNGKKGCLKCKNNK